MDNIHYLKVINREVITNPVEYIGKCERRYQSMLHQYVREVVARPGANKIIMLSGPSSSGKTTGANKMARLISRMGHNAYVISLDDFYLDRNLVPKGEDGTQDFETIYALNLDLIRDTLRGLGNHGEADLPSFDFVSGMRTDNSMHLKLLPGDVVIVEGLHAINPIITDCLSGENLVKMYVSTASDILDDDGNIFFSRRDVRFLRRMIRDYQFRGSSVENTYNMWPKVVSGEMQYLNPLIDTADYIIDSLHPYEICAYKDTALTLLSELSESHPMYENAVSLSERLEKTTRVNKDIIPKTSLLREFVGP